MLSKCEKYFDLIEEKEIMEDAIDNINQILTDLSEEIISEMKNDNRQSIEYYNPVTELEYIFSIRTGGDGFYRYPAEWLEVSQVIEA